MRTGLTGCSTRRRATWVWTDERLSPSRPTRLAINDITSQDFLERAQIILFGHNADGSERASVGKAIIRAQRGQITK